MKIRFYILITQHYYSRNSIKNTCKTIGLREFWDFQVRQGEIRFAQPDYMAMFRIKWDKNG